MTEQHAAEAATIEAMHTGDYAAQLPDLEYTPITDPLPAVVRADELARLRNQITELHCDYSGQIATLELRGRELEAKNARQRAELNGWNTMPAEELIIYRDEFGNDNDIIGEWINELRHGVNVGRYYAGLEPL